MQTTLMGLQQRSSSRSASILCKRLHQRVRSAKFGLLVDDVVITKDSESWDDIGVPALVRETASDLVCGYHPPSCVRTNRRWTGHFCSGAYRRSLFRVQLELAANGVTRAFGIPKVRR